MNLTVTGFGACMIAGYPLSAETGFLHQAIHQLHQTGGFKVEVEVVTMGGFPAHRARKHLATTVLSKRPDIVVLQFGSTDASTPLRNNPVTRQLSRKDSHARGKVSDRPLAPADYLKSKLRSLLSEILLVPPIAPLEIYQAAMLEMVHECRTAGSKVVVVSPFVMGSGRSNRFARRYGQALKQSLPKAPEIRFLDAHSLLSQWPRQQMLLQDGFHLSAEAHQKLGAALAPLLAEIAEA